MNKHKRLIYKYTVKIGKNSPDTHYVLAPKEPIARKALAKHLDVPIKKLRFNKNNLPYHIREFIFDPNNEDYQLTLDIKVHPDADLGTIEERKTREFDQSVAVLKSLKYRIKALARHDKAILLEYANLNPGRIKKFAGYEVSELADKFSYGYKAYETAYKHLKGQVKKHKLGNEKFNDNSAVSGLTFHELLDWCAATLQLPL